MILLLYPEARVVGVDRRPTVEILQEVRRELPPDRVADCMLRFHYVRRDLLQMTAADLDEICQEHLSVPFDEVRLKHASPNCQCNSTINQLGRLGHRDADGNPVSSAAKHDDAVLAQVCSLLLGTARRWPNSMITIEQPASEVFLRLAPVQQLLDSGVFQLVRTSYCKANSVVTGLQEDSTPEKPSMILTNLATAWLPQCHNDCDHRLKDRPLHHCVVVCKTLSMVPGQTKIYDVAEKARIPKNVFFLLWLQFCKAQGTVRLVCGAIAGNKGSKDDAVRYLHSRLGHVGGTSLALSCREMGLPEKLSVMRCNCRACLAGKITKASNTGHIHRGRYFGELVWMDVLEFETPDLWGRKYLLLLVEDVSRGPYGYPMKAKSEVAGMLAKFVKNQFLMAILRTDGGGEMGGVGRHALRSPTGVFDDEECTNVNQFCADYGIIQQTTVPYNHDMMGPLDVVCRRLANMIRTALYAADLPKQLWGPCAEHMCQVIWYLVNSQQGRSPYMAVHNKSPLDEVRKLITFGARMTFAVEPKGQKLDMRGHRGIYIGQDPDNGGARVIDLEAVDPKVVVTLNYSMKQIRENIQHEPRGVTDEDLLVDLPKMQGPELEHVPLRVVNRVALPAADKLSSMWRAHQQFQAERTMQLQNSGLSNSEIAHKVKQEWRAEFRAKALKNYEKRLEVNGAPAVPESDKVPMYPTPGAKFANELLDRAPEPEDSGGVSAALNSPTGSSASHDDLNSGGRSEAEIDDIPCEVCGVKHDSAANPILLCSACEQGYHVKCLGAEKNPSPEDADWYCRKCRKAGMVIYVHMPLSGRHTRGRSTVARQAVVKEVYDDGTCKVQFTDPVETVDRFTLDVYQWQPWAVERLESLVAAMSVSPATRYLAKPPSSAKQALRSEFGPQWAGAMIEHFRSLYAKHVFVFTPWRNVPEGATVLQTIWIFTIKVEKFKARLCCLGNHAPSTDLETASPVVRTSTWKFAMAFAVKFSLAIRGIDMVAGFTQTKPQRGIYLRVPAGVTLEHVGLAADESGVLYCNFNLFGMPEAPYDLYTAIMNAILAYQLVASTFDCCLYHWPSGDSRWKTQPMLVITHVDDIKIIAHQRDADAFIAHFQQLYDIEDLGNDARWQGVQFNRTEAGLYMSQARHVRILLHRAGLEEAKGVGCNLQVPIREDRLSKDMCCKTPADHLFMKNKNYRELVGGVLWCCKITRWDVAFAAKELARYFDCPGPEHWNQLVKLLHYLRKNIYDCLFFPVDGGMQLSGYGDADYNGSKDERLSTGAWIVFWGQCRISECSRTHKYTARSVLESEYGAMASLAAELIYWRQFLIAIDSFKQLSIETTTPDKACAAEEEAMVIHSDSASAIASGNKPLGWLSDRLKHVQNHVHFFRQWVQTGLLKLSKVSGKINPANIGTKGFNSPQQFKTEKALSMAVLPVQFRD